MLTPAWIADDYPIGALVFAEGLGTYLSALAYPGRRDDEYLWMDSIHHEWLRDCEQAWPTATAALRQVLDEPCGGAGERRFFSANPSSDGDPVPTRFGYYVGLKVLYELGRGMTSADLLTLDIPAAQRLILERLDGDAPTSC